MNEKALSLILAALAFVGSVTLYVIRSEVLAAVSGLDRRVTVTETILPEIRDDVRQIKDDVQYLRNKE